MDHGAVPVVVDAGSGVIKAGFAGDDKPKALFSNVLGRPKHKRVMAGGALEGEKCVSSWHTGANGDGYNRTSTVQRILCQHLGGAHSLILFCSFLGQQVDSHRGALIVSHPMERGAISDWDGMARVLSHIFDGSNLSVPPEEQPMLITEAPMTSARHREQLAQLVFEKLRVPALHVAPCPTLALYGSGRTTGVVLDVGDTVMSATPIYEGFALSNAGVRSDVGGRDVTAQLQSQLRRSGHAFHTSAEVELLRGLKEAACYVARNPLAEEAAYRKEGVLGLLRAPLPAAGTSAGSAGAGGVPSTSAAATVSASSSGSGSEFVLPDGSRLVLGPERFRAAEVLFQPRLLGLEYSGAHEAVAVAVSKSDLELRRSLLQNVVLAGGATATRGFGERLLTELRRSLPPDAKVKIWAPAERKVLAWVGGSILASLGTFRGMCVSKEAWEEAGPAALARMATV